MKTKKIDDGYFLRLDKGEEVVRTLVEFIAKEEIQAGAIAGIGALTQVELGYFDRDKKVYNRRKFEGIYELLSLLGNISYADNVPMVHAHCLLGDAEYKIIGGHFFSGIVAVTGEIYIRTFAERLSRELNPETGLKLLAL